MTTSLAPATVPAARGDHTATASLTPLRREIRATLDPGASDTVAAIYYSPGAIASGSLDNIGEPPAGAHIVGVVHAARPIAILPDEVAGITGLYLVSRLAGAAASTVTLSGETDSIITGDGTIGKLAKFATSSSTVGDSIATESSGVVSVAGALSLSGNFNLWTGQSGGWRDLIMPLTPPNIGPTIPLVAQIGSSVISAPKWQINDAMWIYWQLQHDYAVGTDVYMHVHWIGDGADVTNAV
jgi:hypothetical protein